VISAPIRGIRVPVIFGHLWLLLVTFPDPQPSTPNRTDHTDFHTGFGPILRPKFVSGHFR
jgi:hypothetical protein